ncbi:tetratricopeptide repeat protein [Nonomuraea dietziae]|uniref:tetratricopeptide repeat protein n=1 Tax=Nonomuraea dietziae TaxID=65515 RepID=UPI0031D5D297
MTAGTYAAEHGWPEHAVLLARTLYPYLDGHAHHAESLPLYGGALEAARHLGDRGGEVHLLNERMSMNARQGRYDPAHDDAKHARDLAREIGDRYGEARALNALGDMHWRERDDLRAEERFRAALELFREVDAGTDVAIVLGNLGLVAGRQGRYDEAERGAAAGAGGLRGDRAARRAGHDPRQPGADLPVAGAPSGGRWSTTGRRWSTIVASTTPAARPTRSTAWATARRATWARRHRAGGGPPCGPRHSGRGRRPCPTGRRPHEGLARAHRERGERDLAREARHRRAGCLRAHGTARSRRHARHPQRLSRAALSRPDPATSDDARAVRSSAHGHPPHGRIS